jgi:hypothetical protein
MTDDTDQSADEVTSPLDALGVLAAQEVSVTDGLDHVELFTLQGLLTILWHGRSGSTDAILMLGGAMGGLLGPAGGLYQELGSSFTDEDITSLRVSYRVPNDLDRSVHDAIAAAELAARDGAERFVLLGHSFGGAVAVQAAIALGELAAGVVTFATQSAGCENAELLGDVPIRLYHGDRDELLPLMASQVVATITGGDLVELAGTGHLMTEAGDQLRAEVPPFITTCFESHRDQART